MHDDRNRGAVGLNWVAILSYTGSLAVSLAIWVGLFRVIMHFAR